MAPVPGIDEIRLGLSGFLRDETFAEGVTFDSATPLASLGVDSMALVQVLLFVERRFGVEVPDAELTRANTATVDALALCIERAIRQRAEAAGRG